MERVDDDEIRHQPGFGELSDTTLAVRRLISAAQDLTVRTAREMGMNVTDMSAILLLNQHGSLGVAELARRLGVSSPAATVLVDRLQRVGFAERVPDAVDRRRVRVTDTDTARAAAQHAWSPAILRIDEVCRSFPRAHQELVQQILDRLTVAMTGDGPTDPAPEGSPAVGNPRSDPGKSSRRG